MKPIRVLVADDHTIVRDGLVALLNGSGDCQVVAQAADGITTVDLALKTQPDVVVVDISMPKLNGIEVVRRLTKELESTRILVLTMHAEEEYVMHVVRAGAAGFLLKDSASAEMLAAVRALAGGRGYFGTHASKVLAQQVQKPHAQLEDPYRDLTSRDSTYPASRFVYGEEVTEHSIVLDFNKAINPPCAFTEFAVCPLPPPANVLPIRIEAGEKWPH